jgi:hypothetical protein
MNMMWEPSLNRCCGAIWASMATERHLPIMWPWLGDVSLSFVAQKSTAVTKFCMCNGSELIRFQAFGVVPFPSKPQFPSSVKLTIFWNNFQGELLSAFQTLSPCHLAHCCPLCPWEDDWSFTA